MHFVTSINMKKWLCVSTWHLTTHSLRLPSPIIHLSLIPKHDGRLAQQRHERLYFYNMLDINFQLYEIAWAVFATRCGHVSFIEKEELVYIDSFLLCFLFFSMHFSEYFKDAQVYLYILIYFSFSCSIFALSLLLSLFYPVRLPFFLKFSYKKNGLTYAYMFRHLSIVLQIGYWNSK